MSSKNPFQQQLQSALSPPEPSPRFQERLEGCIIQAEPGLGDELTQGEKESLQKGKLLAGWIWSALLLFLGSVGYAILKLLLPGKQKTKRPGRKMAWNGIRGKFSSPKIFPQASLGRGRNNARKSSIFLFRKFPHKCK